MLTLYLLLAALALTPIRLKTPRATRALLGLLAATLLVAFVVLTPEPAKNSAPFHSFAELEIAFLGCTSHVARYDFCNRDSYPLGYFFDGQCLCSNENAVATLAHCYTVAYPTLVDAYIRKCNTEFNGTLTTEKVNRALATYDERAQVPAGDSSNRLFAATRHHFPDRTKVQLPVRISNETLFTYRDAYDQFLGNYNRSIVYGMYIVAAVLGFLGVVAVGNWTKVFCPAFVKTLTGPVSNAFRKHISLPAAFGKRRTEERPFRRVFDHLMPTRGESLALVALTCLVVYLCNINIHYVHGDPFFKTPGEAYQRYYAVRCGVFSSYLMPFSVLFAGRNNLLQWLTKWEYSTFVMLHRWVSRVLVALIAVHSVCYGELLRRRHSHIGPYIYWGVLGFYLGIVLLFQGLLFLRRKWYEAFLVLHIVLAVAFLVGAWFHVKDLYFLWLYYCSAWLWLSDRLIRIHSLCHFGFPKAEVQLFEDNCLKVRVPKPPGFRSEGGGHCFLHFLTWWSFWQSHPFTYTEIGSDIIFYVKVKDGVTDSLRRFLERNPNKSAYIRVAVEGSYGEATPAFRYNSSVFVAGGNGIPGIYAEALHVLEQTRSKSMIKLIWVVREYHSLLWFYDELVALEDLPIETEIYVTRPTGRLTGPVTDKLALLHNTYTHKNYYTQDAREDPVEHLHHELKHVKFYEGRPDVQKIVEKNIDEATGSVCFVSCGHPKMVDELRYQVVQAIGKDGKRVDYFEQLQVWS